MGNILKQSNKSFTLIELLIVIAIIAIIAGAVLVAINPAKRIAQANDARRYSEVRSVLTAVNTYIIDNKGQVPICTNFSSSIPADNIYRWVGTGTVDDFDYTVASNGCDAVWLMDGNTTDACGGGNNGTLVDVDPGNAICSDGDTPPQQTAGYRGNAYDFDGCDDGINVADASVFDWDQNDNFSVSYWMKKDSLCSGDDNEVIMGRDDSDTSLHWWSGVTCFAGDDGEARIVFCDGDITCDSAEGGRVKSTTKITDGNWHHIVGVRDAVAGDLTLYLDGVEEGLVSMNPTSGFDSADKNINIGWLNLSPYYHYTGIIDEMAFFNRALTEDDINNIYLNGLSAGADYCDLDADLVTSGGYLSKIPEDPTNGDSAGTGSSGYLIKRAPSGAIFVKAPFASQYATQEIMVSR